MSAETRDGTVGRFDFQPDAVSQLFWRFVFVYPRQRYNARRRATLFNYEKEVCSQLLSTFSYVVCGRRSLHSI